MLKITCEFTHLADTGQSVWNDDRSSPCFISLIASLSVIILIVSLSALEYKFQFSPDQ